MRRIPALLALTALAACSGMKIRSDYDPAVDFSVFQTYAWLAPPPPADPAAMVVNTDLLTQRVRRAVDANLGARGMRLVPEGEASLLVTHHVNIEQRLEVNTVHYGYGYGAWYDHGGYYGGIYADTYVDQYEVGTLVIDFIDPGTRQLVWRGTAQSRLRDSSTPEQREQRVREAVDRILEKYPPQKK
jgi:hypothetical protein